MNYKTVYKKKVERNVEKLPKNVKKKFFDLVKDPEAKGPIQPKWMNYSKLNKNEYHCHLTYAWVACWKYENN